MNKEQINAYAGKMKTEWERTVLVCIIVICCIMSLVALSMLKGLFSENPTKVFGKSNVKPPFTDHAFNFVQKEHQGDVVIDKDHPFLLKIPRGWRPPPTVSKPKPKPKPRKWTWKPPPKKNRPKPQPRNPRVVKHQYIKYNGLMETATGVTTAFITFEDEAKSAGQRYKQGFVPKGEQFNGLMVNSVTKDTLVLVNKNSGKRYKLQAGQRIQIK